MNNKKKIEEHTFDFVVVGGGTAGLATAIAAARHGTKTAIIQDRPVFGGNSSSEIRVSPLGSSTFNAWSRETGIIEEWILDERARNHADVYDGMGNSNYDLTLHESAKKEKDLTLFMNTTIRDVNTVDLHNRPSEYSKKIISIHGSQLASEKEFLINATQFADCTGDATLGALAGAEFRYGRESRSEFNEPMAPIKSDKQTMGSSITMRARNIGRHVKYQAPDWSEKYYTLEDIGPFRKPSPFNKIDYGGFWWMEIGTPFHQIDDNQAITDELLKHVFGVWNFIKNHSEDKTKAENYAIEWVGMVPGKRESRRLVGDIILTEDDTHNDKAWPDRICHAGWFIDLHTMGALLNKNEPGEPAHADLYYRNWTRVSPFSIPLRSLYSKNIENLWMAGRNISVSHVALGSTRVMMTHAEQGQAIGTAAAIAIAKQINPRQVSNPDNTFIKDVQQTLIKDDAQILNCQNEDINDLALQAQAESSSDSVLDFGDPITDNFYPLDISRGVIFPQSEKFIETIEVYIKNLKETKVNLKIELQELNRIWDRDNGIIIQKMEITVEPNFEGWLPLPFNTKTTPEKPMRLVLHKIDGIFWAESTFFPTGTNIQDLAISPGGCESKNKHMNTLQHHETAIPAFELWTSVRSRMPLSIQLTPMSKPYSSTNVNNGFAWPISMPNLWVSDPNQKFPQSLTLKLNEEVEINTLYISFDTHLDYSYQKMKAFWKPSAAVKDWHLHAMIDGKWVVIYSEKGNHKRRRKITFNSIKTEKIKIKIDSTNKPEEPNSSDNIRELAEQSQGNSARIYEIRIYKN
ncbi:MAG: hypothetical protein COA79_12325 [Planctomycetota bacterium]|nr:MAG: hypothetical protein COA79_12325 [Planctomycetota bacterium]